MTMQIRQTFVPSVTLTSLLAETGKTENPARSTGPGILYSYLDKDQSRRNASGNVIRIKIYSAFKNSLNLRIKKHTSAFI